MASNLIAHNPRLLFIALLSFTTLVITFGCGESSGPDVNDSSLTASEMANSQTDNDTSQPSINPNEVLDDKSAAVEISEQPAAESADQPREQRAAKYTNRLAKETSPYLLMHAHNPVDWYAWGPEALERAKKEDKVIFLSVGYSSCHWCHVMERESFMDEEIAAFLNENFVCIKLDREERPDIDSIYMMACQIMNRSGGWPLSAFLTPDTKPFFVGTYFPPRDGDRGSRFGFLTILRRVHDSWTNNREGVTQTASELTKLVADELQGGGSDPSVALNDRILDNVVNELESQFDEQYGGFGYNAQNPMLPKFPEPSNLFFLLHRHNATSSPREFDMVMETLDHMSMGGIRDHVDGGFHRYSVDRFWRIPHFEKMLYDNAQLATILAEAYQISQKAAYRATLVELLEFVLRDMTSAEGGFYSALDAESEGEEGKYYRWEENQLARILNSQEMDLAKEVYALGGHPNFENKYFVAMLTMPLEEHAEQKGVPLSELRRQLAPIREKLSAERKKRTPPLMDTKILASWNGLMIRGFADAGRILNNSHYVDAASRAARFLLENLRTEEGRLLRTYSNGTATLNAYLDDYSFVIDGLIALHRATGDDQWLGLAEELQETQNDLFWDDSAGGYFFTSSDHETLIARGKSLADGARPAGNSVAACNLVYLADALPKPEYLDRAERTVQAAGALLNRAPAAAPRLADAISRLIQAQATNGDI